MELGLTIPLIKHLKIKPPSYGISQSRLYCWELHRIPLQGKHVLLAVHCDTRYTFVRGKMTAPRWKRLPEEFEIGLTESFLAAGFAPEVVEQYLMEAGPMECTKTHGRQTVAYLNLQWDDVAAMNNLFDCNQAAQPALDQFVNQMISAAAGYPERICTPIQRMQLALSNSKNLGGHIDIGET